MRRNNFEKEKQSKEVLGDATEVRPIDRALDPGEDLSAFQEEVERGMDALVGQGGFVDLFRP